MTKIRKIILYGQTEALPLPYPIPTGIPGNQTMLVATKIVSWCSTLMQATNGEMWPAQRNIRSFVKADTKCMCNKVVTNIQVVFFFKLRSKRKPALNIHWIVLFGTTINRLIFNNYSYDDNESLFLHDLINKLEMKSSCSCYPK